MLHLEMLVLRLTSTFSPTFTSYACADGVSAPRCLCLVHDRVCSLRLPPSRGARRVADGASRGRGSKRATLAASLAHASLTVPFD